MLTNTKTAHSLCARLTGIISKPYSINEVTEVQRVYKNFPRSHKELINSNADTSG